VYGYWGISKGVGRVSYAVAGRDVTVAVVRPVTDPRDIEELYKKVCMVCCVVVRFVVLYCVWCCYVLRWSVNCLRHE
jgi:membrane protein required for beta-lactamase induction